MKHTLTLITALLFTPLAMLHAAEDAKLPPLQGVSAVTLTAQTGKPNFNVFVPGDPIPIEFTVTGLTKDGAAPTLNIQVVDAHAKPIDAKVIPVSTAAGTFKTSYTAPTPALGFYRVFAALSTGETLPARGSKKAGYLTYAIVPDPAKRQSYPPEEARFGMQGGFNGAINPIPYLGVNWVNDKGKWQSAEPDHAGKNDSGRTPKSSPMQTSRRGAFEASAPCSARFENHGKVSAVPLRVWRKCLRFMSSEGAELGCCEFQRTLTGTGSGCGNALATAGIFHERPRRSHFSSLSLRA
jgi:hypothetical protein